MRLTGVELYPHGARSREFYCAVLGVTMSEDDPHPTKLKPATFGSKWCSGARAIDRTPNHIERIAYQRAR